MGLIYKNFDGVPMIGVSMGDRFEHAPFDGDDWELEQSDTRGETEVSDLCALMSKGYRDRSENTMFASAPRMDVFDRLLVDTAKECAKEEGLSVRGLVSREVRGDAAIVTFYHLLRREWLSATTEEGLDAPCPSRRIFVHAVIAELRAQSRPDHRG
ncbi:hypothetical protein CO659_25545 [Rhizobium sp. S9]|uniref:hypothetical protein n=1 Tax=unclassified Rhizobium TaxID=2613769 RepID=UPI000A27016D|nr:MULTISPECIES: hypothetical protein [unclassified Rhizobium]PDS95095.1 hypothetical protein CO659_25545 [Rhizobium sp. S9]